MSELLTVNYGYTLAEYEPSVKNYSYQDTVTQVSNSYSSPIIRDADGIHGNFATYSNGNWVIGDMFTYSGSSNREYLEMASVRFWSWADSAYRRIRLRELSQDPNNSRMRTYDVYDSVLEQIKASFTVDIGYQFNYNFPGLAFVAKGAKLRNSNSGLRFDYIVSEMDVILRYGIWNSTGTRIEDVVTETIYSYAGLDAAVYPQSVPQSQEYHSVTQTITTS